MTGLLIGVGVVGVLAAGLWSVHLRLRIVIVKVTGVSMEPTLSEGDRMIARRVTGTNVEVGQIVVAERPAQRDDGGWEWPSPGEGSISRRRWIIKRVAALPGDPVPDPVLPKVGGEPGTLVPPGHLVILGDNSYASIDSREVGYVPADMVLAVALRRYGQRTPEPRTVPPPPEQFNPARFPASG